MERTIYIISWNGCDRIGGVERVVGIWKRILEKEYKVVILDKEYIRQSNFWRKLYMSEHPVWLMVLFSLCAAGCRRRNGIIIGNGFNAPFVRKDISVAHGTTYALKKALGQPVWSGSTPFERISLRNSKKLLAVSNETKEDMICHYGIRADKIHVINNCVDTGFFYPIENLKYRVRTILFCGRLEERKGIGDLRSLAKCVSTREDIRLCIAATDQVNTDMFKGLRNVEIRYGVELSEMNEFYNHGDVLYFPSKSEGFEMVTLESLAAGVPVVGNNVGAIRELTEKQFEGVYLLNHGTAELTLNQLIEIMDLYRNNFQKRVNLHNRVKKELGVNRYAEEIKREVKACF